MCHLGGLARLRNVGHDQPVFLAGQSLRELPDGLPQFRPLDDAPGVFLALAKRDQPGKEPVESPLHHGALAIAGQSRKHRFRPLRERALDAADLFVTLAADLPVLLPPPHLP